MESVETIGILFAIIFGISGTVISVKALKLSRKDSSHTRKENTQTRKLSDFSILAGLVGTSDIVKDRNDIYRKSEKIQKLIFGFEKQPYDEELQKLHDKIWYVYTVYNRIGFILCDTEETKFKEQYVKFHGPTLCKLFILLHGLIEKWHMLQGAMNYPYLQELVIEIKRNPDKTIWKEALDSIFTKSRIKVYNSEGNELTREDIEKLNLRIIQYDN